MKVGRIEKGVIFGSMFAMSTLIASNALAAQTLSGSPAPLVPSPPLVYASEIDTVSNGALNDAGVAGTLDLLGTLHDQAVPANGDVRVTITLNNGMTFGATPAMADICNTGVDGIADSGQPALGACLLDDQAISFSILTGGGIGDNEVVFMSNIGNGGFVADQQFTIDIPGVTVANQNASTIDVAVSFADNFGSLDFNSWMSEPYITFAPALVPDFNVNTAVTLDQIDVTQTNLFFDGAIGDVDSVNGNIGYLFTPNLQADSAPVADADTILSNVDITITGVGGFPAFTAAAGGNIADGIGAYVVGATAATRTQGVGTIAALQVAQNVTFTVGVANTTPMEETTVEVGFDATAKAGYTDTTADSSGFISPLDKNGSHARLTFGTDPASANRTYVRITNPSTIDGKVYIDVINDAGDTVTIELGDISGYSTSVLKSEASTGMISAPAILTAAQSVDPTFTINAGGKFRLDIEAEFGDDNDLTSVLVDAFVHDTATGSVSMISSSDD